MTADEIRKKIEENFKNKIAESEKRRKLETKEKIEILTRNSLTKAELKIIKKVFGEDVDIIYHTDESIIGGILVKKGDQLFDGTIKGQIELLRKKLYSI